MPRLRLVLNFRDTDGSAISALQFLNYGYGHLHGVCWDFTASSSLSILSTYICLTAKLIRLYTLFMLVARASIILVNRLLWFEVTWVRLRKSKEIIPYFRANKVEQPKDNMRFEANFYVDLMPEAGTAFK